jgi:dTDP-glucose 4,6-dehydratase
MAYNRYHGVKTHIVRIFNTYGPRMRLDDGRALPNFMSQAIRGEDLTVFGDGSQTRSLCYVSDLVEGLYRLLMSDDPEPVNLGNPEEVSMQGLAEEILEVTGSESPIKNLPFPEEYADDPKVRRPDITRARRLLGWEPQVSRAEGLRITCEYFRKRLAQKQS